MSDKLKVSILNPDKLVKMNELKEITNPIYFIRPGVPSSDGLLSNEIFGISKDQRANIFAYIDLGEWFIDPLSYKIWCRMDSKVKECVHGTKSFIINSSGQLQEDENGKNGVKFLKDNIDKIKIKSSGSKKRDTNIDFVMNNKKEGTLFLRKYIVIPAYYRDVNSSEGKIGVGEINQLYDSLLIAVRALKETSDYGLTISSASTGRVQEILVSIYNWFTKEPNLAGKYGIVKRSVLAKTADYSSRLVLSAPQLKVEKTSDLMVDLEHCAVPLSSLCANLYPYIVFWIRRFFENEFSGTNLYNGFNKKTQQVETIKIVDPLIAFSDDIIKKNLDRFIHGYSNRFIPVEIPVEGHKNIFMRFKGRNTTVEDAEKAKPGDQSVAGIFNRRLTWCDLIFMAASEVSKDKCVLITRYPLNDYFGQFPNKIRVASTKDTEPMYINNEFYKYYPKIREEDIGTNTSNKFIDTLNMCNMHLGIIGGDYEIITHCCLPAIERNKNYLNCWNILRA